MIASQSLGVESAARVSAVQGDGAPADRSWGKTCAIAPSTTSLKIRTELMLCLQQHIDQQRWTLEDACRFFHQPSPRMQNLLNGEIGRFSTEELIDLLTSAGISIQVSTCPARPA